MYEIRKDGEAIALTEKPNYIRRHEDGYYVLCDEKEAQGIAVNGTAYHLMNRPSMEGVETVFVTEIDAGGELRTAADGAKMSGQLTAATKIFVQQSATDIADAAALQMPSLFKTWEEALAAGTALKANEIISCNDKLYRVVTSVTPLESQRPDGESMLAVYRPIDQTHAGTQTDPVPFIYGMDTEAEKYYSYNGKVYLCKLTMPACVYAPDTPGLWQWEEA
jgi:hypothetical protein|nr:MAG TPA: hypothetical protein [Caudoviricetes sp.]